MTLQRVTRVLGLFVAATPCFTGSLYPNENATNSDDFRAALESGGYIEFTNNALITISEPLRVTSDLTIDGNGFTVVFSGGELSRVFEVVAGARLTLANVTVANGRATNGAGIFNEGGSVTAIGCTFESNMARGNDAAASAEEGEPAAGGAIHSRGNLVLVDSTFWNNSALGGAGAPGAHGAATNALMPGGDGGYGGAAFGGAVFARERAVLSNCVFIANSAAAGNGGYGGRGGSNRGVGGRGGTGGDAGGGALDVAGVAVFTAITCVSNSVIGGRGGAGGRGGTDNGTHGGDSGHAGNGGSAAGAAITIRSGNVQVKGSGFSNNFAAGGSGGRGTPSAYTFEGRNGNGGSGGATQGAAICADVARTVIERCTFEDNIGLGGNGAGGANSILYGYMFVPAQAGGGGSGGSADGTVFNRGNMTVVGCTFSGNTLHGGDGGAGGHGGRPQARTGSSAGSAGHGGHAAGGAIYQMSIASVINCTFVGNECRGGDGANGGTSGWGSPSTSLFGGHGGFGGGAMGGALSSAAAAVTRLGSVTIVSNSVLAGVGGRGGGGFRALTGWQQVDGRDGANGKSEGANIWARGRVLVRNSIVANSASVGQTFGTVTDRGRNLCSDNTCGFRPKKSLNDTDPMLEPLADNGGPTPTMLPREGSPAINAAARHLFSREDQRGFKRAGGRRPDIGAVEVGAREGAGGRGPGHTRR